jgi:hypothetical protein
MTTPLLQHPGMLQGVNVCHNLSPLPILRAVLFLCLTLHQLADSTVSLIWAVPLRRQQATCTKLARYDLIVASGSGQGTAFLHLHKAICTQITSTDLEGCLCSPSSCVLETGSATLTMESANAILGTLVMIALLVHQASKWLRTECVRSRPGLTAVRPRK